MERADVLILGGGLVGSALAVALEHSCRKPGGEMPGAIIDELVTRSDGATSALKNWLEIRRSAEAATAA